ncbi:MAG: hypothetical protein ACOC3F_02325, partial [Desulfosudaceae bacterium]
RWLIPPAAGLCQLSYWGITVKIPIPGSAVVNPACGGTLPTELLGNNWLAVNPNLLKKKGGPVKTKTKKY